LQSQRGVELTARGDVKFGEDLAQVRIGANNSCSPANGSSISDSTPVQRSKRQIRSAVDKMLQQG
jgi:hypothetical protein